MNVLALSLGRWRENFQNIIVFKVPGGEGGIERTWYTKSRGPTQNMGLWNEPTKKINRNLVGAQKEWQKTKGMP